MPYIAHDSRWTRDVAWMQRARTSEGTMLRRAKGEIAQERKRDQSSATSGHGVGSW